MKPIVFSPIGLIHTPFSTLNDMPIQPNGARGVRGEIHLNKELVEGLKDLEGFSHIHMLYHFHMNEGYSLTPTPFMDDTPRGLFSTRAPRRPNMIGMSIVRIERIEGNIIHILDVDVLDGTPLLDIKPYVAKFDVVDADRFGWLDENAHKACSIRSDERFVK